MTEVRPGPTTDVDVVRADGAGSGELAPSRKDQVATEEPLEIRLAWGASPGAPVTVAVTMRTPGHDFELATGFLFSEGIVGGASDVLDVGYCLDPADEQHFNVVSVTVAGKDRPDLRGLERHFFATSSCGVCGKAALEQLQLRGARPPGPGPKVAASVIAGLPGGLSGRQAHFATTGGLHAAALFTPHGQLVEIREDVGRHNAVDKLVGWALRDGAQRLTEGIVLVSGRASFEVVQKCLTAGVPVLAAVSAPTSLAVATARAFGMTLAGFVRGGEFNIYSGAQRIIGGGRAIAAASEPGERPARAE